MAEETTTAPKETTAKAKAAPAAEGPPVAESGPHLDVATATYPPGRGNWSDPPELAKGESEQEGSFAAAPEEEVAEERAKIEKEGAEARAKAFEDNNQKLADRAKHDEEQAKGAA